MSKPVVEGLFSETAEGARLHGSRCATCKTPYFPKSPVCHNPSCDNSNIADADFGPSGKIWSLALQDYPPPAPTKYDEPYERYAMAVVDLDDGLRVLGRIATDTPDQVQCDQKVELIVDTLYHEEDGSPVSTWKFRLV